MKRKRTFIKKKKKNLYSNMDVTRMRSRTTIPGMIRGISQEETRHRTKLQFILNTWSKIMITQIDKYA